MEWEELEEMQDFKSIRERFIQSPFAVLNAYSPDEKIILEINHAVSTETREPLPGEMCYATLIFNFDEELPGDDIDNGVMFESHHTSIDNLLESMGIFEDMRMWDIRESKPAQGEQEERERERGQSRGAGSTARYFGISQEDIDKYGSQGNPLQEYLDEEKRRLNIARDNGEE